MVLIDELKRTTIVSVRKHCAGNRETTRNNTIE